MFSRNPNWVMRSFGKRHNADLLLFCCNLIWTFQEFMMDLWITKSWSGWPLESSTIKFSWFQNRLIFLSFFLSSFLSFFLSFFLFISVLHQRYLNKHFILFLLMFHFLVAFLINTTWYWLKETFFLLVSRFWRM